MYAAWTTFSTCGKKQTGKVFGSSKGLWRAGAFPLAVALLPGRAGGGVAEHTYKGSPTTPDECWWAGGPREIQSSLC